jgi:hypothetical protein
MPTIIDPVRIYEYKDSGVSAVATGAVELGTGNNQVVVAAVTGKRIRVMGWSVQGTTSTQGYFYLKSASGGSLRTGRWTFPASTALPWHLPVIASGYFETVTGEGLYIDITTAALSMDLYYTTYTP